MGADQEYFDYVEFRDSQESEQAQNLVSEAYNYSIWDAHWTIERAGTQGYKALVNQLATLDEQGAASETMQAAIDKYKQDCQWFV